MSKIQLEMLKKKWSNCKKCSELVKCRTNIVFGVGDPDKCKVVIIGEAPGKNEDINNEPFVGRSGKVLNEFLESINLSRDEVYITNTILCRPPENRDPKKDELKNCLPRLEEQIKILNPKVVITLGNFATKYMLGTKVGITKIRGKVYEKLNTKIVPMQHPAVLLYNGNSPKKRAEFQEDFNKVKEIIK